MDETTGSEYGRRADAVANREKVLVGARQAFADLGIHAEIKDIAERSGVGVGTIYRHFESKEGLLRAIVLRVDDEITASMEQAATIADPIDAIRSVLMHIMEIVDTYGWLVDAVLGQQLPPAISDELHQRSVRDEHFERMLRRGVDAGILRPGLDPDISGRVLMGALLTLKYGPPVDDVPREDMVDAVLDIFLHGAARR